MLKESYLCYLNLLLLHIELMRKSEQNQLYERMIRLLQQEKKNSSIQFYYNLFKTNLFHQ